MTEKINVTMAGGAPWGFRLQGGGKVSLVVHKIRPKSKSHGVLREGDEIASVNGINLANMTYDEVMNLVENSGNELKLQVERLACFEKLSPSEVARQQGPLKRPRRQADSTAESYERSYTTPDGYQVKESKMYKTSHHEEEISQPASIRCHTKIVKLPEDIIKRSSLVRSPIFESDREGSSPIQSFEKKTTIKREYHEKTGTTKSQITESSFKDQPSQSTFSLSPVLSKTFKQAKQGSFVHQAPRIFTIEKQDIGTAVETQNDSEVKEAEESAGTAQRPIVPPIQPRVKDETPPVTETVLPSNVQPDSIATETTLKDVEISNESKVLDATMKPIKPTLDASSSVSTNLTKSKEQVPTGMSSSIIRSIQETPGSSKSTVTVKCFSHQKVSDGKVFESITTETTEKDDGVTRNVDTKTKTMCNENNAGMLPNDHVTFKIGPESYSSSQTPTQERNPVDDTTMPGVTNQSQSSSSLFKVSKFSSQSPSNYSWCPSSQKPLYGKDATKRHTGLYEGRPIPPLPPPAKPPRQASTSNLENNIMSFSEQVKQEICTPERRGAAERGEDRRSASLEMIRKALIPPSEDELKETLITKTKKKMFSSSSFYEEPNAIYPTVEEQFDLAQKIANSLSSDTNRKSKGADMFIKRVKKSDKWIHQSPSPEIYSTTQTFTTKSTTKSNNVEDTMSSTHQNQVYPLTNGSESDSESTRHSKLKPVWNPIRPQDSQMFKGTDREFKTQGLALSPDVCANLVQDLNTFKGKGAKIFANRRKKSEKWIVDESNVSFIQPRSRNSGKTPPTVPPKPDKPEQTIPQNRLNSMIKDGSWMTQKIRYVKSPWEAALESPIGSCDAAFEVLTQKYVPPLPKAPTEVIKARLPDMIHIEKSETPARTISSNLYRPKTPRGWAKSVHDPTSSDLLGCASDIETSLDSDSDFMRWGSPTSHKYGNYNTLPKSWGRTKKETSSFRPVRTSLYSAA